MSDSGRGRASLGVEVWKSSQKGSVQRSAVRSITWLRLSSPIARDRGSACIEFRLRNTKRNQVLLSRFLKLFSYAQCFRRQCLDAIDEGLASFGGVKVLAVLVATTVNEPVPLVYQPFQSREERRRSFA